MRIRISFNGVDGSGKTTQLEMLQKNNQDIIECFGGLEQYLPYKEIAGIESFEWWFYRSSPQEFCNIMYSSIKQREEDIKMSQKPIILMDKGIDNFDARIIATLQVKGIPKEEAYILVQMYKEKYHINDIEELKLFFSIAKTAEERIEITNSRVTNNMSYDKSQIYQEYQYLQNETIENQISNNTYTIFEASGTIEEVNKRLVRLISKAMKEKIKKVDSRTIYALGGMSESGKSGAGEYLSKRHNIWNMKLKYIVRNINMQYDVEDLFENAPQFSSVLIVEQINQLLGVHYYKEKVSFESLHDFEITKQLKQIYGDVFKIIFIDTNYKNRVIRTAMDKQMSIEQAKEQVDKKDEQKSSVGADKIKSISDYIIDNNGTQLQFMDQLDEAVIEKERYKGAIREITNFNIPADYQETLTKFYNDVNNQLGDEVKFFLVTGSCSRECVIPNWSDIDIILVVNDNNKEIRDKLSQIINKYNIKIGTTVYSEREFRNKKIDLKTAYALNEMRKKELQPTICDSSLEIPIVTESDLKEMCGYAIPSALHSLRRLLYTKNDISNSTKNSVFKELSHLMRDYLLQENINATNYQDVFNKFARKFGLKSFNVQAFILGDKSEDIIEYCNNIIDCIAGEKEIKKEVRNEDEIEI